MKKDISKIGFKSITGWRGDSLVCPQAFGGDMFSGCSINCFFCFCRELDAEMYQKYYDGWTPDLIRKSNPDDFKQLFDLAYGSDKKTNRWDIQCLRHGLPFNMGSKSEPFMKAKDKLVIKVLRLFQEYKVPVIFETKTIYAGLNRYRDIIKNLNAAVIVSIMGGSDTLNYKLEENCPPASTRWQFVEHMNRLGIWTAVRWEPVMPTINATDDILKSYAKTAAKHGARHVSIYHYRSSDYSAAAKEFKKHGFNFVKLLENSTDDKWYPIGKKLFAYLKAENVPCSTPDFVNFPFESDRISCCGTDELFAPYLFNYQYALYLIKKNGKVSWDDMENIDFKEPKSYERMKKTWNGGGGYYSLVDAKKVIIIGKEKGFNIYGRKDGEFVYDNSGLLSNFA